MSKFTAREIAIFKAAYSAGAGDVTVIPDEWIEDHLNRTNLPEDRTVYEATREADIWKQIALYSADCQAATASQEAMTKSVSATRKERLFSICRKLADMIEGKTMPPPSYYFKTTGQRLEEVVERLRLAETYKP